MVLLPLHMLLEAGAAVPGVTYYAGSVVAPAPAAARVGSFVSGTVSTGSVIAPAPAAARVDSAFTGAIFTASIPCPRPAAARVERF